MEHIDIVSALAGTFKFNVDYKISTGEMTPRTAIQHLRRIAENKEGLGGINGPTWCAGASEARRRVQADKRKK